MNIAKAAPVRQISLVCIPTREQDRAIAFTIRTTAASTRRLRSAAAARSRHPPVN